MAKHTLKLHFINTAAVFASWKRTTALQSGNFFILPALVSKALICLKLSHFLYLPLNICFKFFVLNLLWQNLEYTHVYTYTFSIREGLCPNYTNWLSNIVTVTYTWYSSVEETWVYINVHIHALYYTHTCIVCRLSNIPVIH